MNWSFSRWASERADRLALRQAGFSEREIDGLCQLRWRYQPNDEDDTSRNPDPAHLCFLRWLVREGKLTEDLP